MKEIDIAEKGRLVVKVIAIGKQAHGSTPEEGVNAIFMMTKLLNKIEKLKLSYNIHPLLGHPTMNLGEIHGGIAPNVVPGTCTIYLDFRILPGMKRKDVIHQLEDCISKIEKNNFKIDVMSESIPFSVDPENELVKLIQKTTQDELRFTAKPMGMGGGTYAKNLIQHGVLTVGWGPGGNTAHIANEYIEIQQLVDFARLTCLLAFEILK